MPASESSSRPSPASPSAGSILEQGPVIGNALLRSTQDGRILLALDLYKDGRPLDGLTDLVAAFQSSTPLGRTVDFRGMARVERGESSLKVTALDGSASFELTVNREPSETETHSEPGVHLLFANGASLVTYERDFGVGLERVVKEAEGLLPSGLASISESVGFQDDTGGGGTGGGCSSSCSTTCAGGGGSCTVSCPAGKCGSCTCGGSSNTPTCTCS